RVEAEQRRPATGGPVNPEQQPDRGRLPGPVRAQVAVHLARLDGQIEAVESQRLAVTLGQALGLDRLCRLVQRGHITGLPSAGCCAGRCATAARPCSASSGLSSGCEKKSIIARVSRRCPSAVKMSAPSQRESWPCIISMPVCIATSTAE